MWGEREALRFSNRSTTSISRFDCSGPNWRDLFELSHEPITALGNRLYEFPAIGPFAQGLAQERNMRGETALLNGGIYLVTEQALKATDGPT